MSKRLTTTILLGTALIGVHAETQSARAEDAVESYVPAIMALDLIKSIDDAGAVDGDRIFSGPVVGIREMDGDSATGMGADGSDDQSLIGLIGLQAAARFESPLGPVDSLLLFSLEQGLGNGEQTAGHRRDTARRNLSIEDIDATDFRLENAISLRIRGTVSGLFDYESRIRVRSTGIREVSARIRIKF